MIFSLDLKENFIKSIMNVQFTIHIVIEVLEN